MRRLPCASQPRRAWCGNATAMNNAPAFNDSLSGSIALFGQDVTPLFGYTTTFGGGYVENLPSQSAAYCTNTAELEGIMMCLACHDGVVAKGQMMNGQSWEQRMSLLPSSVYGTRPIPTLLGNDSGDGNLSGYTNDHPVGTQATLKAVGVWTNNATTTPLTITISNSGSISGITPNSAAYVSFNSNYGFPAIAGSAWSYGVSLPNGDTNPGDAFLTCTTCHNQHNMYAYTAPKGKQSGAAIVSGGVYPSYFFVNSTLQSRSRQLDPDPCRFHQAVLPAVPLHRIQRVCWHHYCRNTVLVFVLT